MNEPFVLLDGAAWGASARLYSGPVEMLVANTAERVPVVLEQVRRGLAEGLHAVGFMSYEAAGAFEPSVGELHQSPTPLAWWGLFAGWQHVDAAAFLPDPAGALVGTVEPLSTAEDYQQRVEQVLALIAAGDLYQANLSFRGQALLIGDPLSAYAQLRARAGAGYGALVATGAETLLSLSPELFFSLFGDRLTCRPMKGTARRGPTPAEDRALANQLAIDAKQRAENLMIVDLIRNDLARVAVPGSVEVPTLFEVERYPTVHQMTSTVAAKLAPGCDALDVLAAAFPCGSITGAPKVRAMQVIRDIEGAARGAYTGSIGWIEPGGDACFNVAIRTLSLAQGETRASLSLGAGIVADSVPAAEWEECMAKGAFVGDGRPGFDLVETMAFEPEEGIALLERHLERMKASAELLGFTFDRHAARNELQAATFRLRAPRRIRLMLAASGALAAEIAPMPPVSPEPLQVTVVPLPVSPADLRLRHKTSARDFYDTARRAAGTDEVVFEHDGLLTEGSFTSLFVPRGDGLVTPATPHQLPGVLRAELLSTGRAMEGELRREDLAGGFFVGNALRGLLPAVLAVADEPNRTL